MTSISHHGDEHAHGRYAQITTNRIGLWLFLISETMVFAGLLVVRFYLQGTFRPEELSQVLGLIVTSILLVSSLTMYRAEVAISHGDQKAFMNNTLITLILGIVFVAGVAYEWSQALIHFPPNTLFGTVFFAMTGMHLLHVISGLVMLALMYWGGSKGKFSAENHWTPEAVAKYWHMVDVVWVFFYVALYLV
jgi:cytochrome c oxidase subunit III